MSIRQIKHCILWTCERIGLFALASWCYRSRLQILCYHGFETRDETRFRPQLFISAATFRRRLAWLAQRGMNAIGLDDAVARLYAGTLPPRSVVVTIDDGFASTLSVAQPLLKERGVPATVYVTTYYVDHQVPVFRLALQYLCWQAQVLGRDLSAVADMTPAGFESRHSQGEPLWRLIEWGEALGTEAERSHLLDGVAARWGLDIDTLRASRALSLLDAQEVRALSDQGMDIQLHTHRHRFPALARNLAIQEIAQNQARLQEILGSPPWHFCYPSGLYRETQWPWLSEWGARSATTCLAGLNDARTPRYGLRRFLDSEFITDLEFRAEISGFNEWLRMVRKRLGGV